jgi:hypothetical protein
MGSKWRQRMARLRNASLPEVEADVEPGAQVEEAAASTPGDPPRAEEDAHETDSDRDAMSSADDEEEEMVWAEQEDQPASRFRAAEPLAAPTESREAEAEELAAMDAMEPHLAPVHQSDWEDGIVWGGEDSDGEEEQTRPFLGRAHEQARTSTSTACDVRLQGWEGGARRATQPSVAGTSSGTRAESWVDKARRGLNPRHLRVERDQVRGLLVRSGPCLLAPRSVILKGHLGV